MAKATLALVVAILAIYVVVSIAAVNVISRMVFARDDAPADVSLAYEESRASAYGRETVSFDSGENTLCGYYYPGKGSKGLVVFAHGVDSCADSHLTETAFFLDSGWSVFAFDATGVCSSGGESKVGLVQTKLDLEAALSYLKTSGISQDRPVCLYGHSMGGYAAAAALADGIDVSAVCCISAFNAPDEISVSEIGSAIGPLAAIEAPFVWLHNHLLFGDAASVTATDGINARQDVPVLVVYGTEDEVVPAQEAGIVAHKKELVGSNASFLEVFAPYRNHHATAWLSEEAAGRILAAGSTRLADLPLDERLSMSELDGGFMSEVESFFSDSTVRP